MNARRSPGLSNGGHRAVDDRSTAGIPARDLAAHLRRLALDLLQQRYRQEAGSGTIELVGAEGQDPSRGVPNDRVLNAVEIGPARLPIFSVAGQQPFGLRSGNGSCYPIAHLLESRSERLRGRLSETPQPTLVEPRTCWPAPKKRDKFIYFRNCELPHTVRSCSERCCRLAMKRGFGAECSPLRTILLVEGPCYSGRLA